MQSVAIHDRPRFSVVSYGNGLAYEFIHKPSKRSVYFQGEGASEFRVGLEGTTRNYDDYFAELWSAYAELSEPMRD